MWNEVCAGAGSGLCIFLPLSAVRPRAPLLPVSRLATTLVGGLVCRCPLRLCRWRQVVSMEIVVFFTRDPTILKRC